MIVWRALAASLCLTALGSIANAAATFTIRSIDAAGEGFNDPTPFTPTGGNNATTLGQARMNLFNEAARIWGTVIQSSVTIQVDASFDSLACAVNSGTLGSAGPASVFRDSTGPTPDVYFISALADSLAGRNLSSNPASADIIATFNSAVDSNDPNCLGARGFYYGFDHNRGTQFDLLLVLLHELGHGLGFLSTVDLTDGSGFTESDNVERFDSFTYKIYDEQFGMSWPAMTDAQRLQSATHTGALAWDGASVKAQVSRFTQGVTVNGRVRLYAPATISPSSSVSHFDTVVTPSVLMEPNLPLGIITSSTDITPCALQDFGWVVSLCPQYAGNHAPVAQDVAATAITAQSTNVTLVASDFDSDPLTYVVVTPPAHGTLTGTGAARTYQSNDGYTGADSFTYLANDGVLNSNTAVVAITVQAPPPPPPPPPPPSSSGGGGGAIDGLWALLLGLLAIVHAIVQTASKRLRRPGIAT